MITMAGTVILMVGWMGEGPWIPAVMAVAPVVLLLVVIGTLSKARR